MPSQSSKWELFIDFIKDLLSNRLKKYVTKIVLKKAFGAALGGVKGFIATYLVGKVWNKYIQPWIDRGARKAKREVREDKYQGIVDEAKKAETMEDFDNSTRDLP